MINKFSSILWIILVQFSTQILSAQNNDESHYYYYQGEKVYLEVDRRYISLNIDTGNDEFLSNYSNYFSSRSELSTVIDRQQLTPTDSIGLSRSNIVDSYLEITLSENIRSSAILYNNLLDSLNTEPSIIKATPCFKNDYDNRVGMTNRFYVQLKNKTDEQLLYSLSELYGLEVLGKDTFIETWYTLACNKSNILNSLELANIFEESNLFASAEPEFMFYDLLSSNDTYYNDQWGFNNTGQHGEEYVGIDINVEDAWAISTGEGINVAIYDSGFEMNHPDLIDNVLGQGFDAQAGTEVSEVYSAHGTACAGIVGAVKDNNIGVAGVAPNTNLISISRNAGVTAHIFSLGFEWAYNNEIDVISNSWTFDQMHSTYIRVRIEKLLRDGRDGKGIVIVFATGNANHAVSFPANCNDSIIAVGAIDITTNRANFPIMVKN